MKKYLTRIIIILSLVFLPLFASALNVSAGIPKDLVWFSKDPFFAGDTIVVYTIVYNSTNYELRGVMELQDASAPVIGKKDFDVGAGGRSVILSFPWRVTPGGHALRAVVTKGSFTLDGKVITNVDANFTTTAPIERFAEVAPPAAPDHSLQTATAVATTKNSDTSSGPSGLASQFAEHLPAPVVSVAVPVLGSIEQFRVSEALRARETVNEAERSIVASSTPAGQHAKEGESASTSPAIRGSASGWNLLLHGASNADILKTPFQYVKLFFALIFSFLTTNIYAFYILLLLIIYKSVRLLVGIFF